MTKKISDVPALKLIGGVVQMHFLKMRRIIWAKQYVVIVHVFY